MQSEGEKRDFIPSKYKVRLGGDRVGQGWMKQEWPKERLAPDDAMGKGLRKIGEQRRNI